MNRERTEKSRASGNSLFSGGAAAERMGSIIAKSVSVS